MEPEIIFYDYSADDMTLACQRYQTATGHSHDKFFTEWLGMQFPPYEGFVMPIFRSYVGRFPKLEMLLNPNWYTLMKVWMIQHGKAD